MFAQGTIFINTVDTIDCALFDRRHGVVGQSWQIDIRVCGAGDKNYFVYDFGKLKKEIRSLVRETLDHRLLVPSHSSVEKTKEKWLLQTIDRVWSYTCPVDAVYQLSAQQVDKDSVTAELSRLLQKRFSSNLKIYATLRENNYTTGRCFHYTHGLPQHDGNCQRLLHGHLGTLHVYADNKPQPQLEKYLISSVLKKNIHFLNSEHISQDDNYITASYEGTQGYFSITLPREHTIVLPSMETSIEAITRYLAFSLDKNFTMTKKLKLICYEGLDKGASFELT